MSDLYEGRRGDLGELSGVVHHVEGQIGGAYSVRKVVSVKGKPPPPACKGRC